MRLVWRTYGPRDAIAVESWLRHPKMAKYFSREARAVTAALGALLPLLRVDRRRVPLYYATGALEYQDYGLEEMAAASAGATGGFCLERFVTEGIAGVSPLNQFKVLPNMPLCFAAMEFGLEGDNAVLGGSAAGLLRQALAGPRRGPMLVGAGKVWRSGRAAVGFACVERREIEASPFRASAAEAIAMLRAWGEECVA